METEAKWNSMFQPFWLSNLSCVHIPVGTMLLFSVYFIYVIFGGKIMLPAGTVLFVHNVFKTNWKQKI